MLGASGGEQQRSEEGAQRGGPGTLGVAEFTELVRAAGLHLNQDGGGIKVGWHLAAPMRQGQDG